MSGGLDSVVALGYCKKMTNYNIDLALTFDYGQKSNQSEIIASKKICEYYGVKHEIIKLDWLKSITKTSLVNNDKELESSATDVNSLWVPNRNALFLNIAACYCDSFAYKYIIYGANKDEAKTFPDNTEDFRLQVSKCFQTSTLIKPVVIAPLINYSKNDIVRIAVEHSIPLDYVKSCYNTGDKNCGECESCRHLISALKANNCVEYINILFK